MCSQNGNVQQCLQVLGRLRDEIDNKSAFVCLLVMECHSNRWETEDGRNQTYENTLAHIPFTASLYLSVSLPPLISIAKACVISFSSECCSARPWLGIRLRLLLLLLQPLHDLIRMRRTLTLSLFLCEVLPCCLSSCTSLPSPPPSPLLFLHPVAPFPNSSTVLVQMLLPKPFSSASCKSLTSLYASSHTDTWKSVCN